MEAPLKVLTITDAKKRLLELVDDMDKTKERISLTKNGIPKTVMMSQDDYESLIETLEILSDPSIMASLKKSEEQRKKGLLYDDDEVWD